MAWLGIGILVAVAIVFLFKIWRKSRTIRGKNPFSATFIREPEPLVPEKAERKKVLKRPFDPALLPEHVDAIIIGSGIGGLSTAVLLARAGWKVVVLEQHGVVGGCTHTYTKKGFEFDVGIHYIGQMTRNTQFKTYIDQLTEGQLQWVSLNENFDTVVIGSEKDTARSYPLINGSEEKMKQQLKALFPQEHEGIDQFFELMKDVRKNQVGYVLAKTLPFRLMQLLVRTGAVHLFTKFFRLSQRSLQEVCAKVTNDADLRAVLSYCWGDYGTLPDNSSFAMHAMLLMHYFNGASYPLGGASQIAFSMIPVIERNGSKVFTKAKVTEILVDSTGRAKGVRVQVGKGPVTCDVFAPVIVSDAGVINTFRKLLPKEIADKSRFSNYAYRVGSGQAGVSLFVGLRQSAAELGLPAANYWIYTDADFVKSAQRYFAQSLTDAVDQSVPMMFVSFPSAKDPSWDTRYPGHSTCAVITVVPYEWWTEWESTRHKKRGDEYASLKQELGAKMWQQVVRMFPHLADKVEYLEVGTPLSNNHYIASPKGEIYGLDHSLQRFGPEISCGLRPETDVPGLYMTGQDVFLCGFAGAAYGGLMCASKLLGRNLFDDLSAVKIDLKNMAKKR